jgi:hypothetical protein
MNSPFLIICGNSINFVIKFIIKHFIEVKYAKNTVHSLYERWFYSLCESDLSVDRPVVKNVSIVKSKILKNIGRLGER